MWGIDRTLLQLVAMLVAISGVISPAQADSSEKVLVIGTIDSGIKLTPYISIFEDQSGKLTIDDLSHGEYSQQFKNTGEPTNFGFSNSAWWVKLTLKNNEDKEKRIIIRQDYVLTDYIDFYFLHEDNPRLTYSTGDRLPYAHRPVNYRDFLFPVTFPANSEAIVLMRFASSGPINISLDLHSDISLLEKATDNQLFTGIYYGGLIILVLYNIFLFVAVKDFTFFYYLLYIISYGFYFSVHDGLFYKYVIPENPWLANHSLIILLALSLIWALQFSRSILSIKRIAPVANKITTILVSISAILLVISPSISYKTIIFPISVLTVFCIIHLMAMGFIALAADSKPARYYLVAWSALLVGVFTYMLKSFGILPHNLWTHNGQQVGSLIEMVLLSLAIGSRVNELQKNTYIDSLTNLFNRRYFDERLSKEIDRANEKIEKPLSLLIIDIDNFKIFNDNFGHKIGDEALRSVGVMLKKSTRKHHVLCRYGGEELAVILPSIPHHKALVVAERIRANIEDNSNLPYKITVSIGLATLDKNDLTTPKRLFEAADHALYSAKENGRNRVEYFESENSRREA